MRKRIIEGIIQRAKTDDRIVLMVGDLGYNVVEGFKDRFPKRFVNCGIAEGNMMSVATGMALEGDIVFVYSIGNFPTLRCLEQIRNGACYHNANVKILSVGGGFSYGSLGMTHHATEELGILRILPNMRVYAPADPYEAVAVLDDVINNPGPCYVRLARGQDKIIHKNDIIAPIRQLIPYRGREASNCDVAVLTYGPMLSEAAMVENMLNDVGVSACLYSAPVIKPFDEESIRRISMSAKFIVTMEEHNVIGGLGGGGFRGFIRHEKPRPADTVWTK